MTTNLNVLIRGQSNAQLLATSPDWTNGTLATKIENLLGFENTANTVTLLANYNQPVNSDNTVYGGTSFIGDWVTETGSSGDQYDWANTTFENDLLSYITTQMPTTGAGFAGTREDPTAVVWLQNEYDSTSAGLTTAEWVSAVEFEAKQVRSDLGGQSAATVPYIFVNAIPYGGLDSETNSYSIGSVNQAIKLGMEELAATPSFNAVIGAQADDLDMNGVFGSSLGGGSPTYYGGPHMSTLDADLLDNRLALSIAESFAKYALPGSPIAAGTVDAYGPEVIAAQSIAADQLLVTVQLDNASLDGSLDAEAAAGVGWSIMDGSVTLDVATAATVTDANHVTLTFASPVPTGATAELYYGYGYGRLAALDQPAEGNAIYDTQSMPIWTPASGVAVTSGTAVTSGEVVLHGSHAEYVVADDNGSLYIQDNGSAGDGTQVLPGVTEMVFTDGTGIFDPTGAAEDVSRLYQAALARAPDVAGLEYWTAQINSSNLSLTGEANDFATSPEFIADYGSLSNAGFVDQLYENVLGRAADAAGAAYWENVLASGASEGAVMLDFAESPENEADTLSTAGDQNNAEAYRLYQAAFDRVPGATGEAYWSAVLANGATPLQVAQDFVSSAEFQQDYGTLSSSAFVSALYENAMHRAADASGLSYWTGLLQQGTSQATVLLGFSDSLENRVDTATATHANWVFIPS